MTSRLNHPRGKAGKLAFVLIAAASLAVTLWAGFYSGTDRIIDTPFPLATCFTQLPEYGIFRITAGCSETVTFGEKQVTMQYDAEGLRASLNGPTTSKAKPILVLGGSILAGYGIPNDEETPVAALAKASSPSTQAWINGSVRGYSTLHIALRFRETLDKFKPRLVVLHTLRGPKSFEDAAFWPRVHKYENGYPKYLGWIGEGKNFLLRALLTREFTRPTITRLLVLREMGAMSAKLSQFSDLRQKLQAWLGPDLSMVAQMQAEAEKRGIGFVVLLDGKELNEDLFSPTQPSRFFYRLYVHFLPPPVKVPASEITAMLTEAGIHSVSLSPAFAQALLEKPNEYLLSDNYHLTPAGARLFGKYAAEALKPLVLARRR